MGTALRLGIDPWAFETLTSGPAAAHVGKPGSIIVETANNQPVRLRLQDGQTPGGWVLPLLPSGTVGSFFLPATVIPEVTVTGLAADTPFNIQHELGYKPLVQVLDSDGTVANDQFIIVHSDDENFTIETPVAGNYTVIMR